MRIPWRLMGEDELGSGPCAAIGLAACLTGVPLADLVGPPAGEHGASGCHDLRELVRASRSRRPSPRMTKAGDEAVKLHRPIHYDFIALFTTTFPFPPVSVTVLLRCRRCPDDSGRRNSSRRPGPALAKRAAKTGSRVSAPTKLAGHAS